MEGSHPKGTEGHQISLAGWQSLVIRTQMCYLTVWHCVLPSTWFCSFAIWSKKRLSHTGFLLLFVGLRGSRWVTEETGVLQWHPRPKMLAYLSCCQTCREDLGSTWHFSNGVSVSTQHGHFKAFLGYSPWEQIVDLGNWLRREHRKEDKDNTTKILSSLPWSVS